MGCLRYCIYLPIRQRWIRAWYCAGRARRCQIIHQQKCRKEAKQKRQAAENHGSYPPEPSTNPQKQKISYEKVNINFGVCVRFPTKKLHKLSARYLVVFVGVAARAEVRGRKRKISGAVRFSAGDFSFLNIRSIGMSARQLRSTSSDSTCAPATSANFSSRSCFVSFFFSSPSISRMMWPSFIMMRRLP